MKFTKNLLTVFTALILIVLSVSFASAALTLSNPTDITINKNQSTIVLRNTDTTNTVTISSISISPNPLVADSATASFSVSSDKGATPFTLGTDSASTLTVTASDFTGVFEFGEHTTTLTALGTDSTGAAVNATKTITFLQGFCSQGKAGNLDIRKVDISNNGEGGDEDWKILDEVTVEVEVKNIGADDINDVFVEIGLFDSDGTNVIDDMEFEDADEEERDVGKIRDGDKETVEFKFKVPADFADGSYRLTVKAYSDDAGEDTVCTDTANDLDNEFFNTIDVEREDDEGKFIAFDNIRLRPTDATCGDTVILTTDVYNIGDEDQDQVKVNLFSSSLGVELFHVIRSDLDEGDKETVTFTFVVPQTAQNRLHTLELSAEYDYRDSSDSYRESSDEETTSTLNVIGCGTTNTGTTGSVSITASLESAARAGEELVIRSTIRNLADSSKDFAIDATGFESWATLNSISERVVNLGSQQSKDVLFRFTPNEDASGQQRFTIRVQSGSNIETREVVVTVEAPQKSGGFSFGDNTLLWAIGIINVVLIVLIIIVAVSLSRR